MNSNNSSNPFLHKYPPPFSTMLPPPTSTITSLNPFAPEYNPISPGVSPRPASATAPPPFLLQSSTAFFPPPSEPPPLPLLLSPQFFAYIPSSTSQQHTFYVTSHNPPPPPPPPRRRSCARQRSGFAGGKKKLNFGRDENGNRKRHAVVPLKREEGNTTVMIKNVPYNCYRKELISVLDGFCLMENGEAKNEGTSRNGICCAYDFVYLPIDFRTKKGRGFAFVNFTEASTVWKFFEAFHHKKWESVEREKWAKKIEVVCAKIQGKEALVNHFSQSFFDCETDGFLPVCYNPARDGSRKDVQEIIVGHRRFTSSSQ